MFHLFWGPLGLTYMQVRKFLAAIILAAITLTSGPLSAQEAIVGVDAVVLQPLSQTQPVIGRFVAKQAGIVSARVRAP